MMELSCVCCEVGSCVPLFFMALGFDLLGLVLLLLGIFADLRVEGRFYGDFLIHTGGVLIFSSLGWWLMWYVGNIRLSGEGVRRGRTSTAHSFKQLARKLTQSISRTRDKEEDQESVMKTITEGEREKGGGEKEAQLQHKGSTVTWGRSTCYHNQGFEDSQENTSNSAEDKTSDSLEKIL